MQGVTSEGREALRPAALSSFNRYLIFQRDRGRCQYCGLPGTTLDHVIPRAAGGTNHPENLVTCCRACNRRKGCTHPGELASLLADLIREGRTVANGFPILIVQALLAGHEPPPFVERSSLIEEGIESVNACLDYFLELDTTRIHHDAVLQHPNRVQLLEGMVLLTAAGLLEQTARHWSIPKGRTLARYERIQRARQVLGSLRDAAPPEQPVPVKRIKQAIAGALPDADPEHHDGVFRALVTNGVIHHGRQGKRPPRGQPPLAKKQALFNRERLLHLGTVAAVAKLLTTA